MDQRRSGGRKTLCTGGKKKKKKNATEHKSLMEGTVPQRDGLASSLGSILDSAGPADAWKGSDAYQIRKIGHRHIRARNEKDRKKKGEGNKLERA